MKASSRFAGAIFFAASLAGCALQPVTAIDVHEGASSSKAITAERALSAVVIGHSTQDDVRSSLGETTVVRFESGYEVWVYPIADDASARTGSARTPSQDERRATRAEFVILFAPGGHATKTRLRSGPATVK